jgi:hypothetical protein
MNRFSGICILFNDKFIHCIRDGKATVLSVFRFQGSILVGQLTIGTLNFGRNGIESVQEGG